ncbi:DUF1272 domain-containing protein [Micropruina sp.]|uniref:DUF1272 domain-containing protein n=1 Tax=Micropruina sp. TaxID=2737536 RepID=UPI00344C3660
MGRFGQWRLFRHLPSPAVSLLAVECGRVVTPPRSRGERQHEGMATMLDYRRSCECCGRELAAGDHRVYICSFECTWCASCAATFPGGGCPNCGGSLQLRPARAFSRRMHAPTVQPHSDTRRLVRSA